MAEILFEPERIPPHYCKDEMPGEVIDKLHLSRMYWGDVTPGTVVRCSCGKLYIARSVNDEWCVWDGLGWWDRMKYRKSGKW